MISFYYGDFYSVKSVAEEYVRYMNRNSSANVVGHSLLGNSLFVCYEERDGSRFIEHVHITASRHDFQWYCDNDRLEDYPEKVALLPKKWIKWYKETNPLTEENKYAYEYLEEVEKLHERQAKIKKLRTDIQKLVDSGKTVKLLYKNDEVLFVKFSQGISFGSGIIFEKGGETFWSHIENFELIPS